MQEIPNIINAQANTDRTISVQFANGFKAHFNFENYYSYTGYYAFLSDINFFLKIKFKPNHNYLFWINDFKEEIEIDPNILYSICTQEKIIVNGKTVFDPSRGKDGWL